MTLLRYVNDAGQIGYFTPEGNSIHRKFLRQPIAPSLSYVSSSFNLKRKHPMLHRIRAHKGVDYAASVGTRIRATGSGKIKLIGYYGDYGRTVIINHGGGYSTLYAHLSRYGKFKRGDRVEQGDVIGYVGSSGLATGSHVHYEFRIRGVHKDPERINLPQAESLPESEIAFFRKQTNSVLEDLDQLVLPLVKADR